MNRLFLLILVVLSIFSSQINAQKVWTKFDGTTVPTKGERKIIPQKYSVVQLNQDQLWELLSKTSDQAKSAIVISIPNPNGTLIDFKIWKTSIMEQALQEKFPNIQTYTAISVNNPNITAKIDKTSYGFHAMVYDGENTWFVDPYSNKNEGNYIVYYKKDYTKPINQRMSCEIEQKEELIPDGTTRVDIGNDLPNIALRQSSIIQKTYRLALTCTGEYAMAVAGPIPTVANVLSAMITTLNRVNGIYEKEIGVTLVLIGNNDTLIYLDPNSDPFTGNANNSGIALLSLNQSNTNTVIGHANYDIGHIFSTGGGGIATLRSVCNKNQKARGVTGLSNPVGDAFDIDYVSHEIGHQFGGNHTFNANTGACNGNGNSLTAYEPGSSSTVMGYAGICAANNIQDHSDAYFHSVSLGEISKFLMSSFGGGSCGLSVTGGPAAVAPEVAATHYIPYKTPFELTAIKDSLQGDTSIITYCWEQWNLGNFKQSDFGAANFTEGPSFRTFPPNNSTTRIFPRIDSILNNTTNYRGERLPEVARNLAFKLTVRNVVNGWGTFDISDSNVNVAVINTGAAFEIEQPDIAGLIWLRNSAKTITWNVANTDLAPINCTHVDILLSTDGGYTYPIVLASNVPNNGSAAIVTPDTEIEKARIKVKSVGNIFFDISNYNIKISADTTGNTGINEYNIGNNISVFPNPTTSLLHIKSNLNKEFNLVLTNILGQVLWTGNMKSETIIHGAHFNKGVYFLNIIDQNSGRQTVKKVTFR